MSSRDLGLVLVSGLLLIIAGLVWLFGPFSLIGVGLVLVVASLFINTQERGSNGETVAPVVRQKQ